MPFSTKFDRIVNFLPVFNTFTQTVKLIEYPTHCRDDKVLPKPRRSRTFCNVKCLSIRD